MQDLTTETIETLGPPERRGSLGAAFVRVAETFPLRIALESESWQLTYRDLNQAANRLANILTALCPGSESRVAILMSHDAPIIAAALGVLKAGQIVVPLDPGDPLAHLSLLAEDAEPSVIIADAQNRGLIGKLATAGCRVLDFEVATASGSAENPPVLSSPDQTAFLTYTSGTTGRPKGVMRPHVQLLKTAAVYCEALQSTENDRIPLFSSVSTGQCWNTVFSSLLSGALLCPFPVRTKGVVGLADWIIDRELTIYTSSASIFRTLVKTIDDRLVFRTIRAVRLASESVTVDDLNAFRRHFPRSSVLVHGLSCSESPPIAWSRWTRNATLPGRVLPIGHFVKDMDVSLLGEDGVPVPPGEVGEIVVKSRYLAKGYWRDPKLTEKRFSADLDEKGTRRVWTGDLGRINSENMLEFCGRKDHRIKIRGNRIELGHIERTFEKLPDVDRAAVVPIQFQDKDPVLYAFIVLKRKESSTAARLRQAIRANLPAHMVPSRILLVASLPHNKNGKVDREALRNYALPIGRDLQRQQPVTETEALLAGLWAEVLDLSDVEHNDDFFELGGDSLTGAIIAAHVDAATGIELTLGDIADHPTLSALAAFIDEYRRGTPVIPSIMPIPRTPYTLLSLYQEAMWPSCRGAEFTEIRISRITGPLDVGILEECIKYLIERHEILRTTFGVVDGCPVQFVHPSAPLNFVPSDLTGSNDPEGQSDEIFRNAASRAINLEALPIMNHVLVKLSDNNYRFARITNHMISDGFSGRMIETELAILYEARLQGREPPLPRKASLQYCDYAVWQREVLGPDSPYVKELISWWKKIFSIPLATTRLPFRRLIRRTNLDPNEGMLHWSMPKQVAKRLDQIAQSAGTTHFNIRLAAFAILLSEVNGNSSITIGTAFHSRGRSDAQTINGRLITPVPVVLSCETDRTFLQWVQIVHHRMFEILSRSEMPLNIIYDHLRAAGLNPPSIGIFFMSSGDSSSLHFGDLVMRRESLVAVAMPTECTVYVDEKTPENCHVMFNANVYGRKEVRALMDRYVRFLETASSDPKVSIETLIRMVGRKPLRLNFAIQARPLYEVITARYASSPLLKKAWGHLRKSVLKERVTLM